MIPQPELLTLMVAVSDAMDLAEAGRAGDGYLILLQGLQRANEVCATGEVWGEALLQRYQTAADDFARQYGLGRA
jgi:hypothetical protein